MATFTSKLALFERVCIDGDNSIAATVTGFAFYGHHADVQISWVHSGDIKSTWIVESRLSSAEDHR